MISSIARINSNTFASACANGVVKLWNWKSGEELGILPSPPSDEKKITTLEVRGEFLLCLTKREFFYFNWLTRRLEHCIDAPSETSFTCMAVLPNDTELLIGAFDSRVHRVVYSQSTKKFELSSTYIDARTIAVTSAVTCVLALPMNADVIIAFA